MALVPVRCPSCGASVDLEEGQTVVRCAYCKSTSFLPQPIAAPVAPIAPVPAGPTPPRPGARLGMWIVVAVGLLMVGGIGLLLAKGGVATDYMTDASSVGGILRDGLGRDARYLKITLSGRHTYAEALEDGKVVVHRYDGGFPRTPKPSGRAPDDARARSFTLHDVDFGVVGTIARHAAGRTDGGVAVHATLSRDAALLWSVTLDVDGEYVTFPYTVEGEPLVEENLDFVALPDAAVQRLEEVFGVEARVIMANLHRGHASLEVMAPKSDRDTDRVSLYADGRTSKPSPSVSDGEPGDLAKRVFTLKDVDWKAFRRAVADARRHLDAEPESAVIRRDERGLTIMVYGRTDRGASRNAVYDAKGRRIP